MKVAAGALWVLIFTFCLVATAQAQTAAKVPTPIPGIDGAVLAQSARAADWCGRFTVDKAPARAGRLSAD
jgi:hypothetical protein